MWYLLRMVLIRGSDCHTPCSLALGLTIFSPASPIRAELRHGAGVLNGRALIAWGAMMKITGWEIPISSKVG